MKQIFSLAIIALTTLNGFAQSKDISFTLDDRDRIIRMDERLNSQQKEIASLRNEINTRFESIDDKFSAIDDKMDKLYTLLYFILGGVFGLIGLIMWDRRSYIKPVKEDLHELQNAIRDFAKKATRTGRYFTFAWANVKSTNQLILTTCPDFSGLTQINYEYA